jgi:glutathione S-transferase-like protein
MANALRLYTCHIDRGGPGHHPCRRCHDELERAGHAYETTVCDCDALPDPLTTARPRAMLPALALPDGRVVTGTQRIVAWARGHAPGSAAASVPSEATPGPVR